MQQRGTTTKITMLLMASLLLVGCASQVPCDQLTRWTATASGTFPAYHLRRQGDLAAGTLAAGGGTVLLEGLYYHGAASDGSLYQLRSTELMRDGWAVRFKPDLVERLAAGTTLVVLSARLTLADHNGAIGGAMRLTGDFAEVELDSGVKLQRITGTLYSFRAPESKTAPGRDFYFLAGNLLSGGKVRGFRLLDGSLAIDLTPRYLQIYTAGKEALRELRR